MGATKIFNLAIKVNDKESKTTLNSVGKELKSLRSYTRNLEEGTDKWRAANKKLAETEKVYDGMKKKQREFINQTKEATDETGNNKKAIQDFGQSFGQVTAGIVSGDLIQVQEGLKGMKAGIIGATKASLAFIATPFGMFLAALAISIGAVAQYFRDSEEGQAAWNKITAVSSAIIGNFTDLLSDLGGMLVRVFSDPKQSLIDFGNLLKDQLINRITGSLELLPALAKAVGLLFKGEFQEAGKVAGDAVGKLVLGVEDATGKISNSWDKAGTSIKKFGKEVANEAERSAKLSDLAAQADKIERELLVERGKVEAKVAEARRKARDEENLSAAERQKLLEEAKAAQDELYDKEIQAAEIRRQIKEEENTFSKSTKEDLDEEARLTAQVDQVIRKKADAGRSLMRDELRIKGELKKATGDLGKEDEQRLAKLAALEAEYLKKQEDRLADSASKQAELDMQRALQKAEALGAEQELLDQIRAEHQIKVNEEKAREEEEELQRMREFEDKKLELENELRLSRAENDAERAEIQKQIDLENAELEHEKKMEQFEEEMARLELNEEEKAQVLQSLEEARQNTILGIQKKYTDEKIKDEQRLVAAKKKLWNDSLDAAINLAGQETKIGQALLIAKQVMAAKETAIQLGLFQNKTTLNAAEASQNISVGSSKTAAVGFPQNIPLLIGFAAQVSGIVGAIKNAAKAKSEVTVPGFFFGGPTGAKGLGFKDQTGQEPVGMVHPNEYVIPSFVRKDPEVPFIENYLENKRKKKLGLYADGGDTDGKDIPIPGGTSSGGYSSGRTEALLQDILEAIGITGDIFFGYEAEQKRQEAQKKLDKIKSNSKVKNK